MTIIIHQGFARSSPSHCNYQANKDRMAPSFILIDNFTVKISQTFHQEWRTSLQGEYFQTLKTILQIGISSSETV